MALAHWSILYHKLELTLFLLTSPHLRAGGHDWAVFQFRVIELRPEDPPPPPPEKVWGPIDASGRNYGWTTSPATLTNATGPQGRPPVPPPASSPPPGALLPATAAPVEVGYERPKRQVAPPPPQHRHNDDEAIVEEGAGRPGAGHRPTFNPPANQGNDEDEFEEDFDHEDQQPLDEGREFQQPEAASEEVSPAAVVPPRAGRRAAAAAPREASPEYE